MEQVLAYWWIGAIIAGIAAVPLLMVIIGLLKNFPPMWNPPGPFVRLHRYLTQHVVETSADPYWVELQVRHYRANADEAMQGIVEAVEQLGWKVESVDEDEQVVRAVVASLIFRFKDDVRIWMRESARTAGVSVHMRSESRIGRGDLGANARHVLNFYNKLDEVLGTPGRT